MDVSLSSVERACGLLNVKLMSLKNCRRVGFKDMIGKSSTVVAFSALQSTVFLTIAAEEVAGFDVEWLRATYNNGTATACAACPKSVDLNVQPL
jgi:hypothetical protein